jgi:hypothetical protein
MSSTILELIIFLASQGNERGAFTDHIMLFPEPAMKIRVSKAQRDKVGTYVSRVSTKERELSSIR